MLVLAVIQMVKWLVCFLNERKLKSYYCLDKKMAPHKVIEQDRKDCSQGISSIHSRIEFMKLKTEKRIYTMFLL